MSLFDITLVYVSGGGRGRGTKNWNARVYVRRLNMRSTWHIDADTMGAPVQAAENSDDAPSSYTTSTTLYKRYCLYIGSFLLYSDQRNSAA